MPIAKICFTSLFKPILTIECIKSKEPNVLRHFCMSMIPFHGQRFFSCLLADLQNRIMLRLSVGIDVFQAVVFLRALGAAGRAGFDEIGVDGTGKIRNKGVRRLPRPM